MEESYDGLCFWFWSSSTKLEEETPITGTDDFGIYAEIDIGTYVKSDAETSFSFLVKSVGSWSFKTVDIEVPLADFDSVKVDNVWTMNVYAIALTKWNVVLNKTPEVESDDYVKSARFDETGKTLNVAGTSEISSLKVYAFDRNYYLNQKTANEESYAVLSKSNIGADTVSLDLGTDFILDFNKVYQVVVIFTSNSLYKAKSVIDLSNLFETSLFDSKRYNGDDLGLSFSKDGTPIFKVFAPTSALVTVNIYKHGYSSTYAKGSLSVSQKVEYDKPTYQIHLNPLDNGIHTSENVTDGDWGDVAIKNTVKNGKFYYTYTVYNSKGTHEVVDPYARSTSVNSQRAYIFEMGDSEVTPASFKALPKVWDGHTDYDIESPLDLVISENHIRDLTMDETWTDDANVRKLEGTFKGFAQKGTTYKNEGVTVKTGADHLEEYGVNALQLLPIFDQDNDEILNKYNWGYNPLNYNVPEGSYSSDPYDPCARVYELRELVASYAMNANKTRIIMDVVYNHVSKASNSNFEYLVPGYYFRQTEEGEFLDGSGCGNEFKTEAPMARKFVVDSVSFWAEEYLIKGFRFDLMGLIDVETMRLVKEKLYEIDPDIVVYGEGWDAVGAYWDSDKHAHTTSVYQQLYGSEESPGFVGAFNDAGRDALRGSNNGGNEYPGWGFISQGVSDLSREKVNIIADMFKGNHTGKGGNPLQTINYASCHDNYTLFDQLNWTLSPDGGVTAPSIDEVARASVAVNGFIAMSNGIAFLNGGEELFRTKVEDDPEAKFAVEMYGNRVSHNSYCSSDETNSYKYDRKADLLEYFEMYKDIVSLRKNLKYIPYPENNEDPNSINTWNTESGTRVAGYRLGKDGTCYYVLLNGRSDESHFDLGPGESIFQNCESFTRADNGINVSSPYALGIYAYKEQL